MKSFLICNSQISAGKTNRSRMQLTLMFLVLVFAFFLFFYFLHWNMLMDLRKSPAKQKPSAEITTTKVQIHVVDFKTLNALLSETWTRQNFNQFQRRWGYLASLSRHCGALFFSLLPVAKSPSQVENKKRDPQKQHRHWQTFVSATPSTFVFLDTFT